MASTSINNTINGNRSTPTEPRQLGKHSFCRWFVAAIPTPAACVLLNTVLGTLKGLEIAATEPALRLREFGQKLGGENRCKSCTLGTIGFFAGCMVSAVIVAPSLLIGLVYGIGRGVYTLPTACQQSWNHGFQQSINDTFEHFGISGRKITIIAAVASLLLAGSFIGLSALIGGAALAGLLAIIEIPVFIGSLASLGYAGFCHQTPKGLREANPMAGLESRAFFKQVFPKT